MLTTGIIAALTVVCDIPTSTLRGV